MWAQGLGNAALSVNSSVKSLVKSAESAVAGKLQENVSTKTEKRDSE
jgi:hypothetical protein